MNSDHGSTDNNEPSKWHQTGYTGPLYHGRIQIIVLLEQTLTLDVDLPSLLAMLLPNPPSVDLQNAFFRIMVFHGFDADNVTKFTANEM